MIHNTPQNKVNVKIEAKDIRISGGALAGTKVTDLDVNPWLTSIGIGYRF